MKKIPDKQYHIFQKRKSFEISNTDIYTGKDLEFVIQVFYWCNQLDMKSILTVKKASNLIIVMPSYNIYSGIKSQQAIKKQFVIQYQKLLIFFRIPLFCFIKLLSSISISFFLRSTKKSCKNSKTFQGNTLSTKKKLLKRKENNITPAKTNAQISQTSQERLKLTIQTY